MIKTDVHRESVNSFLENVTTKSISINQRYEQLISLFQINSCEKQEMIKTAINQLPGIAFTVLHSIPSPLNDLELLEKAKQFSLQINDLSEEDEKEKIALLEQVFSLYKNFIKLNRQDISQRVVRDAAMEAVFVGSDIIDSLGDRDDVKKEALQLAVKKIQIISGYSDALYHKRLNQTVDALNIPQKHFAVTSQPLGTTNVKDCIFLVIRNRETHLTFAAHIDRNTDADSILEAIKQYMPQTGLFDSYIIGGHLPGPNISDDYCINVLKVTRLLIELDRVGYVLDSRWQILQEDVPVNIVYYPETDQFFAAVPGKELTSYFSCEILTHLDKENKKLLPYFIDQQQKETECSLCLSPPVQKKLLHMLDQNGGYCKAEILKFIWNDLPPSLLTYNRFKAITAAYSKALNDISSAVKEISSLSSDVSVQKALINVLEHNEECSLYILPFSKEKNLSLIDKVLQLL